MTEKMIDTELDALANITIGRIMEQIMGDIRKFDVNDREKYADLKKKWVPHVKGLYVTISQDFDNIRRSNRVHPR